MVRQNLVWSWAQPEITILEPTSRHTKGYVGGNQRRANKGYPETCPIPHRSTLTYTALKAPIFIVFSMLLICVGWRYV